MYHDYCIIIKELVVHRRRLYFSILSCATLFSIIYCDIDFEQRSHVEVRAVFIDCEPNNRNDVSDDSDNARFQREELFKHNNLRHCKKKLALTVKMTTEPGTVSGILSDKDDDRGSRKKNTNTRIQHDSQTFVHKQDGYKYLSMQTQEHKKNDYLNYPALNSSMDGMPSLPSCLLANSFVCKGESTSAPKQMKRQKKTPSLDTNYISLWNKNDYKQFHVQDRDARDIFKKRRQDNFPRRENRRLRYKENIDNGYDIPKLDDKKYGNLQRDNFNKNLNVELFDPYKIESPQNLQFVSKDNRYEIGEETTTEYSNIRNDEKRYAVYEIGNPDLWYTVHIQLYEKLSTPEGKTIWNDITKEDVASVSTLSPMWSNQDMSIQYRPSEWLSHDEFALPKATLCLFIPIRDTNLVDSENDPDSLIDKFGEYLVMSKDDIIYEEDANQIRNTSSDIPVTNITQENKGLRRVFIRDSRAVMGGNTENLIFVRSESDQYMMIPHRRPHHSQIDVESRADENQLIHVGSSGRIMTAVSDNTREPRTVLTVQVTNTGLAAARLRAAARDCGPGLLEQIGTQGHIAGPALIPPKHTHRFVLDLPYEIPDILTHCHVSLLNDDDDSIAVREVSIKKNDRCFCVWHCKCVCLSVDPKLICREMSEAQQLAAGLSVQERSRLTRSVCYPDNATLNIVVIVVGVLAALLLLGFIKAVLGLALQQVAAWGLDRILKMPRKLDHYYESSLRYRRVTYDIDGWPVHPDTNKRTVQYISKPMEFMLNMSFFIVMPCLIVCDGIRCLISKFKKSEDTVQSKPIEVKRIYSGQDIQDSNLSSGFQCKKLRTWMKSCADELSNDIWRKGLSVQEVTGAGQMRPLLRDECCRKSDDVLSSYGDSEQDDTEYVLMQMQKSRESLAQRSQRKLKEVTSKNQWKDDIMPSTSKR